MAEDVAVELIGISKSFPGVQALAGVSLLIRPGRVHALVGENGAGKSTLINVLSGVVAPDAGQVRVGGKPVELGDARAARRHGIVTVHQEADLFPDLSVAENIGLEQGLPAGRLGWVRWRALRTRARAALAAVGEPIRPNTLAAHLTPAQRQMVEVAAAVSEAARVLILDEPTSSLSAGETEVLFGHLRRFRAQGTAIVYVSHRLEEVFRLADEVTVLRDGRHVWTGRAEETTPHQLIGLLVGREVAAAPRRDRAERGAVRFGSRKLTAADGSFTDITLEVCAGEILGLYGLVGAGRSEWAQAVFGLRPIARGTVSIDGRPVAPRGPGRMAAHGLAYVPEDRLRQGLCRGLSVGANLLLAALRRLARGPWVDRRAEDRLTRTLVGQLAIRLRSPGQPAGTLSGGNQQKVVLGRWLGCDPRVLILDEPTRGVDVGAKGEIHRLIRRLAGEGRAVVLISSDLPEVLGHSDRVGIFREGRLAALTDADAITPDEAGALAVPGETAVFAHKVSLHPPGAGPKSRLPPAQGGAPAAPHPPRRPRAAILWRLQSFFREAGLLVLLALLFGLVQWQTGQFLDASNLADVATSTALLSFPALGAMLVILVGGIDISVGSLMALSAAVAGRLWEQGWPAPAAAALALAVGGTGGLANGALSLAGRVHPIVVTLGTLSVYRGLALGLLTSEVQIRRGAREWVRAEWLDFPLLAWAGLGVAAAVWLLLRGTVTGRELYAVGSNPAAARRVGIHRGRAWLTAFGLQGVLVGLAGFLHLAYTGNLQPVSFGGKTLEAIAAAVVGGVAITGGRGSAWGVLLGCVLLVAVEQASVFLGLATSWHRTLVGGILVAAVCLDALWRKAAEGARR
jgi:ABC-type sugar transport system ATPase subunit/ribose/xylose/arabinose/galactoside ABC-type transport system permease subunit